MATVTPTMHPIADNIVRFTWALTTADHTGLAISDKYMEYTDRTFYAVGGTWGGATLAAEGGDGTNYVSQPDNTGTAIALTADGVALVGPVMESFRPRLTTVGSGASLTATLIAIRPPRGR